MARDRTVVWSQFNTSYPEGPMLDTKDRLGTLRMGEPLFLVSKVGLYSWVISRKGLVLIWNFELASEEPERIRM